MFKLIKQSLKKNNFFIIKKIAKPNYNLGWKPRRDLRRVVMLSAME